MKTNARFAFSPLAVVRHALAVLLIASASSAFAQKLDTIALYSFSDSSSTANLFLDSSGNGNNLTWTGTPTGVAQSSQHNNAAPTDVSVYFPLTHGVAYKAITLSNYTALTFDWHMKTDATRSAENVVFQLGSSNTATGFLSIRLLANTASTPTILRISHKLSNGYDITEFTIPEPSSWVNYALTINNSITGAGHISLQINGVAQTGTVNTAGTVAGTFYNELRIGAATSTSNPFTGYLQNVELYSGTPTPVPEPATTAVLIGLAGAALVLIARRRR